VNKSKQGEVKSLSLSKKEKIVEEVLGVHPKYLRKSGLKLIVDVSAMAADGVQFSGFKHKEMGC